MEDIWKPSKKEKWSNGHSTSSSSPASSSSKFALSRSFSAKTTSSNTPGNLARSGSQRCSLSSSKGSLSRSCSHKGSNISRKCSNMAKEQKAKFYIMKRCVAMLLRWHKHDDS